MRKVVFAALILSVATAATGAEAPLTLVQKIELGKVQGSFGNIAIDAGRGRLLLAETHNNSVAIVDLAQGQLIRLLDGFNLPLDVDYVGKVGTFVSDLIYVSNGGDGQLRYVQGATLAPVGQIRLSGEAEDIILDPDNDHVLVGHGSAISVIDASGPRLLTEIALKRHPEEFVIDAASNRIYANVPDAGVVAVIDRGSGRLITEWKVPGVAYNASALTHDSLLLASQTPAQLVNVALATGQVTSAAPTCGEADTLLFDGARAFVVCGDGNIDIFRVDAGKSPAPLARIKTSPLAHTALLVGRRLYLAVPARGNDPAAIWVYAVSP